MKLDKNKPYGEVYGLPGVAYCQNGVNFDGQGNGLVNYNRMNTNTLKKRLIALGGDWIDRQDAIKRLTNG